MIHPGQTQICTFLRVNSFQRRTTLGTPSITSINPGRGPSESATLAKETTSEDSALDNTLNFDTPLEQVRLALLEIGDRIQCSHLARYGSRKNSRPMGRQHEMVNKCQLSSPCY